MVMTWPVIDGVSASSATARQISGSDGPTPSGVRFGAYEIHLGLTTAAPSAVLPPFAQLDDGTFDGVRGAGVLGTYLHGALESADVCTEIFGIDVPAAASKASQYRRMAAWFEQHARHLNALGL